MARATRKPPRNSLPEAHLSHAGKSRLRLKVPGKQGDADYFATLASLLTTELGLVAAEANPLTAGILLVGEGLELAKLAEAGRKAGLFKLAQGAARRPSGRPRNLPELALAPLKKVDGALDDLTGGFLDLKGLAFAGLLGTGVYQLVKGRFTLPAWHTAFWYALGLAAMYKLTAAVEHREE